jgi:hypothetical protein
VHNTHVSGNGASESGSPRGDRGAEASWRASSALARDLRALGRRYEREPHVDA